MAGNPPHVRFLNPQGGMLRAFGNLFERRCLKKPSHKAAGLEGWNIHPKEKQGGLDGWFTPLKTNISPEK